MRKQVYVLAILGLFIWADAALADKDRVGTAGALELRLPIGARSTALGGAVLADVKGPEALYWNPAGAAGGEGFDVMFSSGDWLADMKLNYFAFTAGSGFGTVGISAKVLDLGEWEQTTYDQPEGTGLMVRPTFITLGLTYAKQMTDRVSFGGTFNYVNESIMNESAKGFAMDFGFQYKTPMQGLNFGVLLKSIGPDMKFSGSDFEYAQRLDEFDPDFRNAFLRLTPASFEIPSSILFGLSYQAMKSDMYALNLTSDAQLNNHSDEEFRFGGEFAYNDMLFLRGGYVGSGQTDYLFGGSFGAGVKLNLGGSPINIDYSYVPITNYFDNQNWFSVKMGF